MAAVRSLGRINPATSALFLCDMQVSGVYSMYGFLKGQSHEKVGKMRVWGVSLGPK
jgi:hypothetical protein